MLTIAIGYSKQYHATIGWVKPENVPIDQPGLLHEDYIPCEIGFHPFGLKPLDSE